MVGVGFDYAEGQAVISQFAVILTHKLTALLPNHVSRRPDSCLAGCDPTSATSCDRPRCRPAG